MTIRTQWVRNVADSYLNRSTLQRLSFIMDRECPPRGATGVLFRREMSGENPSNNVLVDLEVESQGNLLSDWRTAPGRMPLLDWDDGFKEFAVGSLWDKPPPAFG